MKTLGDRLNGVSQAIPGPASTTTTLEYQDITRQNAKARYPNIRYWTKADYSELGKEKKGGLDILEVEKGKPLRGNARMKDGENVMMDFVELEDGTVVDGITAAGIRSHMAAIFNEMAASQRLPETWSKIGLLDREYVFTHLYKAFPYLQLCLDHWKAKEISSRALSTWKNTQKKRVARTQVKLEAEPEADPLPINPGSHKRKSAELDSEEPENDPAKRIHLSPRLSPLPDVQTRPRPRPTALTHQPKPPTTFSASEISPSNSPPHSIPLETPVLETPILRVKTPILETPILETPASTTPTSAIPDLVPSKSTHVQPLIPIGNPM
jgi:hypothetical protein